MRRSLAQDSASTAVDVSSTEVSDRVQARYSGIGKPMSGVGTYLIENTD
jgi:hypothetical protein